jgi:hypothetical protein
VVREDDLEHLRKGSTSRGPRDTPSRSAETDGPCRESAYLSCIETAGKILLVVAAALALVGLVLLVLGKLGLGRLPGDILIRRDGVTIFIPLGSMLLLSVVLSLVVYLVRKL